MITVRISSSNVISCGLPLSFLRQRTMRTVKTRQMVDYERDSEASYLHAVFGRASKKIHTIPLYSESAVIFSGGLTIN